MKKHDKQDKKLKRYLAAFDSEIVIADGLADAFVGLVNTADGLVCVYDKIKVILILKKKNDWDYHEAEEYADFNIFSAYVKRGPLWIDSVTYRDWNGITD
jgi:hypothetical protein